MKTKKVAWGHWPDSAGRLSAVLRPVRSRREVAGMMGISMTLVCQLEASALSKVSQVINEIDHYKKCKLNKDCEEVED